MKKINIYVWLLLAGGLLASCDADTVDGIDFDVNPAMNNKRYM